MKNLDTEWLYKKLSQVGLRPSPAELESFLERVAIIAQTATDAEARTIALENLLDKRRA